MINRKQLEEAAEKYADACNSAWTNDYDGFIAGADFVLNVMQSSYVKWSESAGPVPTCPKCGLRGHPVFGAHCLAEGCPGVQVSDTTEAQ